MPENPNPPVALEYDDDRDRWSILVDDGHARIAAVLPESIVDRLAERITARKAKAILGVQAQVTVIEYAYMGDSAAFIRKPLTYDPAETVGDLLVRAHGLDAKWPRQGYDGERVELQVIQETVPKPEPATRPPGNTF